MDKGSVAAQATLPEIRKQIIMKIPEQAIKGINPAK